MYLRYIEANNQSNIDLSHLTYNRALVFSIQANLYMATYCRIYVLDREMSKIVQYNQRNFYTAPADWQLVTDFTF